MVVEAADDFGAGPDHFSQEIFFLHDFEIIGKVRRRWDHIGERGEVAEAACLVEELLGLEPLLERDHVDGLAVIVHLLQRAEDGLVAQIIKNFPPAL